MNELIQTAQHGGDHSQKFDDLQLYFTHLIKSKTPIPVRYLLAYFYFALCDIPNHPLSSFSSTPSSLSSPQSNDQFSIPENIADDHNNDNSNMIITDLSLFCDFLQSRTLSLILQSRDHPHPSSSQSSSYIRSYSFDVVDAENHLSTMQDILCAVLRNFNPSLATPIFSCGRSCLGFYDCLKSILFCNIAANSVAVESSLFSSLLLPKNGDLFQSFVFVICFLVSQNLLEPAGNLLSEFYCLPSFCCHFTSNSLLLLQFLELYRSFDYSFFDKGDSEVSKVELLKSLLSSSVTILKQLC
jgi:hypothetical protein